MKLEVSLLYAKELASESCPQPLDSDSILTSPLRQDLFCCFVYLGSPDDKFHPSIQSKIGPWPPLLTFHNNNVLRCEVVSLTTNPR
jgi:hypothetical protein